jgi:hypothetical protein
VSPDGQHVAFVHHPFQGADDGELIVVDRAGKRIVTAPGWNTIQGTAWRPDGREVLFTAASEGGNRILRAVSLSGSQRVLLHLPSNSTIQDVAPDGRILLTTGDQLGELRGRLLGSDTEETIPTYDWPTFPTVSNSGALVVWGESGEAMRRSGYGTYLHRPGSRNPVRLGPGGGFPAISPDEKSVAVVSQDETRLMILPVGAGDTRELARASIGKYLGRPAWFGGSDALMFTATERGSNEQRVYVQKLSDPEPRALKGLGVLPSPDGTRFICRRKTTRGICEVNGEGFQPFPVLNDINPFAWSSDAGSIIATGFEGATRVIYRVTVATGARTVMQRLEVADAAGLISVGSPTATADGKVYVYPVLRTFSQLYVVNGVL